jgi:RHS repeat-associated protein
LTFSQTLNARQRPETLQLKNGAGSTLQSLTYGYSAAGDVTWILDGVDGADTVNNLTYDGLHRLKTANGIWGSYSYTYDGLNNLISRTGTNPLNYGYDTATNRLSGVSGAVSRNYGYNPRGGMIGDGTKSFTLNSNDQITSITGIASYGYDGNGKRIKTTQADGRIVYTLYDQSGALVFQEQAGVQDIDYLPLGGQTVVEVAGGVPTYLHPDLLGSPRLATTGSGSIAWREHYGPYGEKLNGVNDKIGYTGHAYDAESQLTYAQARFYDPAVGRFMSVDPIGFTGNPFTFNRYAYVNNNPYGGTDPSGMATSDMEAITGSRIQTAENNSSPVRYAEGAAATPGGKAERMAAMMTGGTAFTGDQTMVAAGGGAERGGERGIRGGLFQDPATEDLDVLNGAVDPISGRRLLEPEPESRLENQGSLPFLRDTTTKGSGDFNVDVRDTRENFERVLSNRGYEKHISKDGVAVNYTKGPLRIGFRDYSKSRPDAATAEVYVNGEFQMKLRLVGP